jgi:starch synthase
MVARLTEQKGIDLVVKAADDMLKLPVQLVILGEGEPKVNFMDKLQLG